MEIIVSFLALAVLGLTLFAAAGDIKSLRIPNWISIVIAALFCVAVLIAPEKFSPVWVHIVAALGTLIIGFVLLFFTLWARGIPSWLQV